MHNITIDVMGFGLFRTANDYLAHYEYYKGIRSTGRREFFSVRSQALANVLEAYPNSEEQAIRLALHHFNKKGVDVFFPYGNAPIMPYKGEGLLDVEFGESKDELKIKEKFAEEFPPMLRKE